MITAYKAKDIKTTTGPYFVKSVIGEWESYMEYGKKDLEKRWVLRRKWKTSWDKKYIQTQYTAEAQQTHENTNNHYVQTTNYINKA